MKLVYTETGTEVKVGDEVEVDGEMLEVTYFREPHKISSSGKVSVRRANTDEMSREYFVGVIRAEWIEREDRQEAITGDYIVRLTPYQFGYLRALVNQAIETTSNLKSIGSENMDTIEDMEKQLLNTLDSYKVV